MQMTISDEDMFGSLQSLLPWLCGGSI